jgi:CO/xanthine dehydrogenase FAD-binding subunit
MKPVSFEYAAPGSLREALELLGGQEDAVVLAGGQSLVPMLNFRLARPEVVVDLNPVGELDYLEVDHGGLRIGALTRQATLERSIAVAHGWPLLSRAVRLVAHPAIRTRGTVGGSVAHADPRAELPAALLALDARMVCRSAGGVERVVAAADFFLGPMTTALREGELLCEIAVPPLVAGARSAFVEHTRTHGDFALVGAAVAVAPDAGAAVALLGAAGRPVRAEAAERALAAGAPARDVAALAGQMVSDEYPRALIAAVVERALREALA